MPALAPLDSPDEAAGAVTFDRVPVWETEEAVADADGVELGIGML